MIITCSIVNNEIDYIKDVIQHHLFWVDKMYFCDTGSTDGTLEYLQSIANDKIVVEQYSIKYKPDHSTAWEQMINPFPEVEVRNFALERCEKLKPNWIIGLDGDEIFLPITRNIIEQNNEAEIISHSTINPVCSLDKHPIEIRNGIKMFDPHARIWRAGKGFKYYKNPAINGQFHCIPMFNGRHLYHHPKNKFIGNIIHMHLHWCYGKKIDVFYEKMGISNRRDIVKDQTINEFGAYLPAIFWKRRKEWIENVSDNK